MPLPLLIPALALGVQSFNTYGKTEADILKMGASGWQLFYTSKAGDNTLTETQGTVIYGMVEEHRNDRIIAKDHNARLVGQIEDLRDSLHNFATDCLNLSENMAGGGTIWGQMQGGVESDVEDVVYGLLVDAQPKKHVKVSDVTRLLSKVNAGVWKEHADHSADAYFHYEEALKMLAAIRQEFRAAVGTARAMSRADSDRILGFCEQYAETAANGLGN